MKKILFTTFVAVLLVSLTQVLQAQILKPVKWSYGAKKINATEAIISFKATIDDGWHIYSQNVGDGGPTKTVFTFPASKQYALIGKTIESKPITEFEKMFNMKVSYFENQAIFQQKIKLNTKGPTVVKGSVEFGACDDHQCIPPESVDFSITVK